MFAFAVLGLAVLGLAVSDFEHVPVVLLEASIVLAPIIRTDADVNKPFIQKKQRACASNSHFGLSADPNPCPRVLRCRFKMPSFGVEHMFFGFLAGAGPKGAFADALIFFNSAGGLTSGSLIYSCETRPVSS